jgi:hypothetical protein
VAVRYLLDTSVVTYLIRASSPILQSRLRRLKAATVGLSVVPS